MKKVSLLLAVACLLCMVSCSKNSPKNVVKTYYSAVQNRQYEEATKCFSGLDGEDDSESMQAIAGKLKEGVEKADGLKSYEILSDSLCNDSVAFVRVKYVYGNGEEGESNIEVVKQQGEWKIDPMSK